MIVALVVETDFTTEKVVPSLDSATLYPVGEPVPALQVRTTPGPFVVSSVFAVGALLFAELEPDELQADAKIVKTKTSPSVLFIIGLPELLQRKDLLELREGQPIMNSSNWSH